MVVLDQRALIGQKRNRQAGVWPQGFPAAVAAGFTATSTIHSFSIVNVVLVFGTCTLILLL